VKYIKIFILLLLTATFFQGCDGTAWTTNDSRPVLNTQEVSNAAGQSGVSQENQMATLKTFTCGAGWAFEKEAFHDDLEMKLKDYVGKTLFPKNEEFTQGKAEEATQNDYVAAMCYNKEKGIVLVLLRYDYQVMGGWSYAFRYDVAAQSLKPAAMTGDTGNMTLMRFTAENGTVMTLAGTGGDGIPNDYTAKYDYEKNEVTP